MSCMQLDCSRESSRVFQLQNLIMESTGYDQMVSSLEAEQVHTHVVPRPSPAPWFHTHAHTCTRARGYGAYHTHTLHRDSWHSCALQTNMTHFTVRWPAVVQLLSPDGQPQALSSCFYGFTSVTHSRIRGMGSVHFPTPGRWMCMSSNEGMLEESQFLKTSTLSASSPSYRKGHRLYSLIRLYVPEN